VLIEQPQRAEIHIQMEASPSLEEGSGSLSPLETLCELLDANRDYGFVHSWRIVVDQQGCPVPLQTFPWRTRFNNRDALFGILEEYGVLMSGTAWPKTGYC